MPSTVPVSGPRPRAALVFSDILANHVNLLRLPRRLPAAVTSSLAEVAGGEGFVVSSWVDTETPDVSELVDPVQAPVARGFLTSDLTAIARAFGATFARRRILARLAVVENDACRKLHTDNVTVRLLCTYAGPGTEWVPDEDALRENLCRLDVGFEDANRSVLRHPDALRRAGVGDVLLLKGEAFPGNRGRGAIHRSPPIRDRGLRRLVLKIDEHEIGRPG